LGRLQSAQPVLSQQQWVSDERHWLVVRNNISKKPSNFYRPSSSREIDNSDLVAKILKRRSSRPGTALSCDYLAE
jgi:hypothetical protein